VRDRVLARTERASLSTSGKTGNWYSYSPSMSADGRLVAFESYSTDLVSGDGNGDSDVFVRDRQAATLRVVSQSKVRSDAAGSEDYLRCCDETLAGATISDDGRFVAFVSTARSLVLPDTRATTGVYVRDLQRAVTVRLQASSSIVNDPVISGDGRYVVYTDWSEGVTREWDRLTGVTRQRMPFEVDQPALSSDGRYLASGVYADLLADDTNGHEDIYVHDRVTDRYERVSVSSAAVQADGWSGHADISGDGRYVTFYSTATNLVANDTNNAYDVFVRDRATGSTERVSVSSAGVQGNNWSDTPSISADGRYVAFMSYASNLVSGDTNGQRDLFVHDRQTHQTVRVAPNGVSVADYYASISSDGRYVTLTTGEALRPGDTNAVADVYVIGWQDGTIERMSVATNGAQANGASELASMSGNGRFVVFNTSATNLGGKDLNGLTDVHVRERAVSSLTVAPKALSFGNQRINTTSRAQSVRVTNLSTAVVPITSVALSGSNPGQFSRTHTCGTALAAGAGCTVQVKFKPTSVGKKSAVLTVNGSGGGLRAVSLTGTGVKAATANEDSDDSASNAGAN
jgi:Tol biopolymer transport system component